MTQDSSRFALPDVVRMEDCEALATFLSDTRGAAATVDCSAVSRLGGLAAQMLLIAQRSWADEGQTLTLIDAERPLRALHLPVPPQQEAPA